MNLKIITPDHNAEEVKNSLLSKKRKINKFLKLDNDYGDDLPELIFYSKKHIDDGYYDFEINGMQFLDSYIRKSPINKNGVFEYICSRYNVFIENFINNQNDILKKFNNI